MDLLILKKKEIKFKMGIKLKSKFVPDLKFHLDNSMQSYDEINILLKKQMEDLIPVWKPINMTSYDVIRKIQSINSKIKVGHCGTLDPFASGVLLLCIGKNTKNISKFMSLNKVYHATINLNEETDTLDLTGKIIRKNNNSIKITKKKIEKSMLDLTGINTSQIPPYFSAKKFHGLKMYEYARNDIFIRRKASLVDIHSIS